MLYFKDFFEPWLMNEDGTAPRRLADHAYFAACAPDGKRVLFLEEHDLYAVEKDGSHETRLTHDQGVSAEFAASPDGRSIAFATETGPDHPITRLLKLDIDSKEITPLTKEFTEIASPAWSPDGTRLAFKAVKRDNTGHVEGDVYVLELSSGEMHAATEATSRVDISWSPDGRHVAIAAWPTFWIWVVDIATNARRQVPLPPGIRAVSVAWSPTGERLAFEAESGCDGMYCGELYTIDIDGSKPRKISNQRLFHCRCYQRPEWSPDGLRIVSVAGRHRHGDMDLNPFHVEIPENIYVIKADGSGEKIVSPDESHYYRSPVWCPGERRVGPPAH